MKKQMVRNIGFSLLTLCGLAGHASSGGASSSNVADFSGVTSEISMSPFASVAATSAGLTCAAACNEAVVAAKDDAVNLSLGNQSTPTFDAAVSALKEANPQLKGKTDNEMAEIILGIQ